MIGSGIPGLRFLLSLSPTAQETGSGHSWNVVTSGPVIFIESLLWQSVKRFTCNSRDLLILLKWSDEVWNMFPLPGEWWPLPPWHGLVTVYSLHEDIQSQLVLPQPNPPPPICLTNWTAVSRVEGRKLVCNWQESSIFFAHISYLQQSYHRDLAFGFGCQGTPVTLAFLVWLLY